MRLASDIALAQQRMRFDERKNNRQLIVGSVVAIICVLISVAGKLAEVHLKAELGVSDSNEDDAADLGSSSDLLPLPPRI